MKEHSWRYQGDKFKQGILVELGIWPQIVWQVKRWVRTCWQRAAFQHYLACLRAIHMLQHMSVRRGLQNHSLWKWKVSQALKIPARIPCCCINWCVSTCIPSNKKLISAQREMCNINQLFARSETGSHRTRFTRQEKVALGCFFRANWTSVINHKQVAVTKMLPCGRAVHTETDWALITKQRGIQVSAHSVEDRLPSFIFYSAFHLQFLGAITCHVFSHFSPTLSLSTVFCDVLEAMEMVSGWLLPSPWLSASSIPSLQEMWLGNNDIP